MKTCSLTDCSRPQLARGWCGMHYQRWWRTGDPEGMGRPYEKHRKSETPEWTAWKNLKSRCLNPGHPGYPDYGGRGITVCAEWRDSFSAFLEHVGPRPGPGFSIDRIDNDGNYEPGNVRWATQSQQNANRRQRAAA